MLHPLTHVQSSLPRDRNSIQEFAGHGDSLASGLGLVLGTAVRVKNVVTLTRTPILRTLFNRLELELVPYLANPHVETMKIAIATRVVLGRMIRRHLSRMRK
jgi:hypothetical protein